MALDLQRQGIRKGVLMLCALGLVLWALLCAGKQSNIFYGLRELLGGDLYHRYDPLIAEVARRHELDPNLVKAVIWRESGFRTNKLGSSGERGLMQVTAAAGRDWANATKQKNFQPEQLSQPEINLEAGCWYLARAFLHWKDRDQPEAFALAEYNAGRSRVRRWVNSSGQGEEATAQDLRTFMDFPSTKAYIRSILDRRRFYQARNEFH